MAAISDSETSPSTPPSELATQRGLAEVLLDAALQAQRVGGLDELVREHPLASRWMLRRHLLVVCGTRGLSEGPESLPQVAGLLLRWLCTRLRPDGQPGFDGISEEAWLRLSGWRPMLAVAAYAGFLPIPDFPRQYRRRPGEPTLDNLCGLWGVGPSTVYRTLERARQAMVATLLDRSIDAAQRLTLREMVHGGPLDTQALVARAAATGDAASELWHHWRAANAPGFTQVLRQRTSVLSHEPETDALVERMAAATLSPREHLDLWLARAALARTRQASDRELRAIEQARAVAQAAQDRLLLGIAHSALGKHYEARDADRAFACYQDSVEFLRDLGPERGDTDALAHFLTAFVRLAWQYLLRNDARSKALLDRADQLREQNVVPDEVLGMLEQVWGQYWRRQGNVPRSLEHRFRALNIFERLGDERSVMASYVNIGFDLAAKGEHDRAIEFSNRILQAESRGPVEPEAVINAHLNLGATYFWKGAFDVSIKEYQAALDRSLAADLRVHAFRARYNLAEAHYTRFRDQMDPDDEASGDGYVAVALASPASDSSPAALESIRALKAQVLDNAKAAEPNRMLPGEDAVHLAEMSEVHRHRELLAVPGEPVQHAQAHLAIARAYLAISTKEREAALALIRKHGLQAQFTAEFEELKQTFQRELTREQHLADAWKRTAADVVDDSRRAPLVAHIVREGSINKSGYAELCGVSPATASKHLGLLLERGLLVQLGKGPSTRYELPPP